MNLLHRLAAMALVLAILAVPMAAFASDAADLYKSKCAMCHGPDGGGDTPMGKKLTVKDLRSPDVQKKSDADLTTVVTKGKDKMPAYDGKLTADQIKGLVAYIRSIKK